MRLTRHRGARQQAVGEGLADRACFRCVGRGEELGVARDQLDLGMAQAVEGRDVTVEHHAAVEPLLPESARETEVEEERLVELLGRDFDPDFVVALVDVEETRRHLRALDHLGKGLLRCERSDRRRRCRGGARCLGRVAGAGRGARGGVGASASHCCANCRRRSDTCGRLRAGRRRRGGATHQRGSVRDDDGGDGGESNFAHGKVLGQ